MLLKSNDTLIIPIFLYNYITTLDIIILIFLYHLFINLIFIIYLFLNTSHKNYIQFQEFSKISFPYSNILKWYDAFFFSPITFCMTCGYWIPFLSPHVYNKLIYIWSLSIFYFIYFVIKNYTVLFMNILR